MSILLYAFLLVYAFIASSYNYDFNISLLWKEQEYDSVFPLTCLINFLNYYWYFRCLKYVLLPTDINILCSTATELFLAKKFYFVWLTSNKERGKVKHAFIIAQAALSSMGVFLNGENFYADPVLMETTSFVDSVLQTGSVCIHFSFVLHHPCAVMDMIAFIAFNFQPCTCVSRPQVSVGGPGVTCRWRWLAVTQQHTEVSISLRNI